ncbi:MAG: rhodanese-like domain-containing protein [Gammaproteobacteria bacterium]|nr:rhodanese-like domain-containing protein [Gammaproteobacteria bacterium]
MKKIILMVVMFLIATSSGWAYDKMMAESYAQYFKPFADKATSKSLHMIKTADFVKDLRAGKLFVIDIRTPGETIIYGLTVPGSVNIPMNQIFKPDNLDLLPTFGKIVIVCKAGHRAMAVSTALRHIGFNNVYSLKLGIQDLAKYLSPKNAY